jgi:hypothetical protein
MRCSTRIGFCSRYGSGLSLIFAQYWSATRVPNRGSGPNASCTDSTKLLPQSSRGPFRFPDVCPKRYALLAAPIQRSAAACEPACNHYGPARGTPDTRLDRNINSIRLSHEVTAPLVLERPLSKVAVINRLVSSYLRPHPPLSLKPSSRHVRHTMASCAASCAFSACNSSLK